MRQFLSCFESFAFKALDFSGRATRMEYWCVVPVIWLIILLCLPGDAIEFWSFLLAREVPPLNPLYYESILVFVLTIIPRFSLTFRRLHDSGKSGKWATLPFTSVWTFLLLVFGVATALLSMPSSGGPSNAQTAGIMMAVAFSAADNPWTVAFTTAELLNTAGWDPVLAMMAEFLEPTKNVGENIAVQIDRSVQGPTGPETQIMLAAVLFIATPFVTALLHLYFMLLPSDRDENSFGQSNLAPITGLRPPEPSHNPMAGYAHLFEKTEEQKEELRKTQKEELKALYQTRVLGRPSNPVQ